MRPQVAGKLTFCYEADDSAMFRLLAPDGLFIKEVEMEDWKEWARNNKAEVKEIADKYSGGFVKSLVGVFIHADASNVEKILNTWPDYFENLYKFKEKIGS